MLTKILNNKWFEYAILSVILANGIILWLETSKSVTDSYGAFLKAFNVFAIVVFAVEAILKIVAYRSAYFRNGWNLFDFSIVVISLIPTSGPFEALRILRVFRLLRLVTMVPSMRKIVIALFSVIPGILSVSALLVLIYYIYAVIVTTLFQEAFPEWFWSMGASFYTLFQIMTLESWSMWIARPVMEEFPYAWIIFVSFVLIATFVMVNLIIAIVVEAMNRISKDEESAIIDSIQKYENATKSDLERLEIKMDALYKLLEKENRSRK